MRDIARVTAWAYAGTNYATELQAIDANLMSLGRKVIKEFAQEPAAGMVKYGDEIAPLLIRRAELIAMAEAPAESLEGTREDDAEGTRDLPNPATVEWMRDGLKAWHQGAQEGLHGPLDIDHPLVSMQEQHGYATVALMIEHGDAAVIQQAHQHVFQMDET